MKNITFLILSVLTAVQANAQLRNYSARGSIKILTEKTTLKINPLDSKITPDQNGLALLAAVGTIAPAVVDFAVKTVQEKVKKEALKYIGIYKASSSDEGFYKSPTYAALPGFTIKREIVTPDLALITASEFSFVPEFSKDRSAFRLKFAPDSFTYRYSVAKLNSPYNFIDLAVEVKIKGLTVTGGVYKLIELGAVLVNIPMIKPGGTNTFDKKIYSGWLQLLPKSSFDTIGAKIDTVSKRTSTYDELLRKHVSNLTETIISTSFGVKKPFEFTKSSGLYEMEVTVTETNPYKIRAEQRTALVDSTAESGTAVLKSLIEVLAPKPEEKKKE